MGLTRDPFLKFAVFTGTKFVGGLINHDQLSMSLGYQIYYSGAPGAVLEQTGLPQLPVVLLNEIAPVAGNFSADDQVKTRAASDLKYSTFTGVDWAGDLVQLTPGLGYQFKVQAQITFSS